MHAHRPRGSAGLLVLICCWAPAGGDDVRPTEQHGSHELRSEDNRTAPAVALRIIGYVPGPQMPLEFGGPLSDFSLDGAEFTRARVKTQAGSAAATNEESVPGGQSRHRRSRMSSQPSGKRGGRRNPASRSRSRSRGKLMGRGQQPDMPGAERHSTRGRGRRRGTSSSGRLRDLD